MHGSGTPQDKDINDFTQISSADLRSILREDLNSAEPDRLSVDEIKIIVGLLKQREDDEFNFESNDTIIQDRITAEESKNGAKQKSVVTRKRVFVRITAAVICTLLIRIVTVFAYEIDIVSIFKSWTQELFQVNYSGEVESSTCTQNGSTDEMALQSCDSASEVLSVL